MSNENLQRSNEEALPFEMGYLPPYFERKAELELNESAENILNGRKEMREMIKNDKDLEGETFDDDWILQFLRTRKYNVASAFARLKAFSSFRKKYPGIFTDLRFDRISVTMKDDILTFLPRRCQDGCAIFHFRTANWDPERFPVPVFQRAVCVLLSQSLRDPMNQVNGYKVIVNAKGNPLKYIRHCTPTTLYILYHAAEECSPGRYKEFHVINLPSAARIIWFIFKSFISNKIKQRVTFHSTPDSLLDYFPSSVLPKEYGGDLEEHDLTDWLRKVTEPEMLATIGGGPLPAPSLGIKGRKS